MCCGGRPLLRPPTPSLSHTHTHTRSHTHTQTISHTHSPCLPLSPTHTPSLSLSYPASLPSQASEAQKRAEKDQGEVAELGEKNAKLRADVARLEAMGEEVPELREKVRPRKRIDRLLLVRHTYLSITSRLVISQSSSNFPIG